MAGSRKHHLIALSFAMGAFIIAAISFSPGSLSVAAYPGNITNDSMPLFSFIANSTANSTFPCELFINGTGMGRNESAASGVMTRLRANASLPDGAYAWRVDCTDADGTASSPVASVVIDTSPPVLSFASPTPPDDSATDASALQVSITSNGPLAHCNLSVRPVRSSLWSNVRHLGISGGTFDYNASAGYGNFSSLNLFQRRAVAPGELSTCHVLASGNSTCTGYVRDYMADPYTGGDARNLSAGYYLTCYVLNNGNSTCYGRNDYGQSANYTGGDATALSAGLYHVCYLLNSGNSACYGYNPYGQSVNYTGGNAIAVSAGFIHTCYLLSTGNSACYGSNNSGQCTAYTGGNAISIATGQYHTCYLLSNGTSRCYGSNSYGQSANYTGGNAIAVSAGSYHTCYLLSNGTSRCYGSNSYGQSANYTGGNAIAVSAGSYHTCYLLSNGNSTCYGRNDVGQAANHTGGDAISAAAGYYHTCYLLSNGTSRCYGTVNLGFTTAHSQGNAISATAGYYYTCYLLSDGTSRCYGSNSYGQSANYTGGNAISAAAGNSHTCYLLSDGTSRCYGYNNYGQSANYTGGNAISAAAGYYHTCYLLSDGTSRCYGDNYYGQSANYTGGNAIALAAGFYHTCYLLSDGTSRCYGYNTYDQSTRYTGGNAIALAAGYYHTCYLLSNGNSTCYGRNDYGQSANYAGGNAIALAAGYYHTCYLLSTGKTFCHGKNDYGQAAPYAGRDLMLQFQLSPGLANLPMGVQGSAAQASAPLAEEQYLYWAECYDGAGNFARTPVRLIVRDASEPSISFLPPTPATYSTSSTGVIPASVEASDPNLANISIYLYYSNGTIRERADSFSARFFNYTFQLLPDGTYLMNATAFDIAGKSASTETRAMGLATVPPAVSFAQPTPASLSYSNSSSFTAAVSLDQAAASCGLTFFNRSRLWSNVRHLNITGGAFDYNASVGPMNASSFQMMSRKTILVGIGHVCYVLRNGNSACYGSNDRGEATNYSGGDAIAVAGNSHTCYLLSTGNSVCYGANSSGQATGYSGGNAIGISADDVHTCYLLSTGNSACYGLYNDLTYYYNLTNYTGGNAIAVGSGRSHTCYLLRNGSSVCTGLAESEATNYTGGDAFLMGVSHDHTCYVRLNGSAACYGYTAYGIFTPPPFNTSVGKADGWHTNCYLAANGTSACYGVKTGYEYGQNTSYTGGDAIMASSGYYVTCYLLASGDVSCFGRKDYYSNYTGKNILIPFTESSAPMFVRNSGQSASSNLTLRRVPDGNYSYWVRCASSLGLYNVTETRHIVIDTAAPSVSLGMPTDSGYVRRNYLLINATVNDTNFANATLRLYDQSGSVLSTVSSASPQAFSNFTGLADGNYTLEAAAYDRAGNSNSAASAAIIDTAPPSLVLSSPLNTTYASAPGLAYAVSDANLNACFHSINGGRNITLHGCSNITLPAFSNGSACVVLYANDSAGNLNSTSVCFTLNLTAEGNAPVLLDMGGGAAEYSEAQPVFYSSWADDSGIRNATLEANFTGSPANYTHTGMGNGTYFYYSSPPLPPGSYSFRWFAEDAFGNSNLSGVATSAITAAAPSLTLSASPGWSTAWPDSHSVSCAGPAGVPLSMFVNGTPSASGQGNISLPAAFAAGDYGITCNTSGNGNYTAASVSRTLSISRAVPELLLYLNGVSGGITAGRGQNASLYGQAVSPAGGSIELFVDGTPVASGSGVAQATVYVTASGSQRVTLHYPQTENHSEASVSYAIVSSGFEPPAPAPAEEQPNPSVTVEISCMGGFGSATVVATPSGALVRIGGETYPSGTTFELLPDGDYTAYAEKGGRTASARFTVLCSPPAPPQQPNAMENGPPPPAPAAIVAYGAAYSGSMASGDFLLLVLPSGNHTLTLLNLTADYATYLVRSAPKEVQVSMGGKADIDLDDDGVPDISLALTGISGGNASLQLQPYSPSTWGSGGQNKTQAGTAGQGPGDEGLLPGTGNVTAPPANPPPPANQAAGSGPPAAGAPGAASAPQFSWLPALSAGVVLLAAAVAAYLLGRRR